MKRGSLAASIVGGTGLLTIALGAFRKIGCLQQTNWLVKSMSPKHQGSFGPTSSASVPLALPDSFGA